MRFTIAIAIFVCWNALTTASDILPEFPYYLGNSVLRCQNNDLSVNFSNALLLEIGRDFISSPLITCLDLTNNNIQKIADGAFNKLPKLTNLYLSNNKFLGSQYLFTFGGHETLKVLTLDKASSSQYRNTIMIHGDYPNLEILSIRNNGFSDLDSTKSALSLDSTTTTRIPFKKLKILNLSGNNIIGNNFVNLLPTSLSYLFLHDNSLTTLSGLKDGSNVVALTLDNNDIDYIRYYSNNPVSNGFWTSGLRKLQFLSISKNRIHTVESVAFQSTTELLYLNLSSNKINSLYPETFAKLKSLKALDLSRNGFQNIPQISTETNIFFFFLDCNKITKVNGNAFARMPKLRQLSLGGNQIDHVDVDGFSYLYDLQRLDLSKNKLRALPKGWTGAFSSLKYLDLSENQFTSLLSLSLTNTLPLVEMYLAMNPLAYLNATSFDTLPKNVTVDLIHTPHATVGKC